MLSDRVRNRVIAGLLGLIATSASAGLLEVWRAPTSLDEVETQVERDFPNVRQLQAKNLAVQIGRGEPLIILDVREPEEFAVSHLADARLIAPGASIREVRKVVGPTIKGARIVMYCSVGYRSSKLADRVQEALLADGAVTVANLRGGIFGWFNDDRPLVNAQGSTRRVHPYDSHWGRLLKPGASAAQGAQSSEP
jgi:rhodanese-related sulfurtransferase